MTDKQKKDFEELYQYLYEINKNNQDFSLIAASNIMAAKIANNEYPKKVANLGVKRSNINKNV